MTLASRSLECKCGVVELLMWLTSPVLSCEARRAHNSLNAHRGARYAVSISWEGYESFTQVPVRRSGVQRSAHSTRAKSHIRAESLTLTLF